MRRRHFLAAGLAGVATTGIAFPFPRPRAADIYQGPLRLNRNENPLGPAPSARRALTDAIAEANRYPVEIQREFTEQLARFHQVSPGQIVLGTGSSEILQMAVQSVEKPDLHVVIPDPTYEAVAQYCAPHALKVHRVPLQGDFSHNLTRMKKLAHSLDGPVLVYICNPNNPTASITDCSQVESWFQSAPYNLTFVIDEAYYHFVEDDSYRTAIPLAVRQKNVVVSRTFSKIYALAGLRLGYGIGHQDTIRQLSDFASRNNTNQLSIRAAMASYDDQEFLDRSRQTVAAAKKVVCDCLEDLDLGYVPSHANFLMHKVGGEQSEYIKRMTRNGFRVGRPFPPMLSYNRLSLALPEDMERFAETLREFRKKGWV